MTIAVPARSFRFALGSAAVALLLTMGAASAATVSLRYDGPTASDPRHAKILVAPTGSASGGFPLSGGAWGFNMTDTSGTLGRFVAWCLDIGNYLGTSGIHGYETTDTPFSNSYGLDAGQKSRVQAMFDANYGSVMLASGRQVAAFQLALWNALHDTDSSLTLGSFQAKPDAGNTSVNNDIKILANTYMTAAAGFTGPQAYTLSFLESTGTGRDKKQNLVTATPIPLPAAGWLLLAGLGVLDLVRRRRPAA